MPERTIWCRKALLPAGWAESVRLHISPDGMISGIETGPAQGGDDLLHGLVLPGMPNLHSHGFQRLMVGLTGEVAPGKDSFWGWRETMYAFANRLTPECLTDCMGWLFAEMLASGYTACAEFHYVHHQSDGKPYDQRAEMAFRVMQAADNTGIGLTLLPVLYQVSGFGSKQVEPHQKRFRNSLPGFLALLADCERATAGNALQRVGVAPHSLRAVPAPALAALLDSIPDPEMPVHIHIAEQPAEVDECLQAYRARPVEWLLANAQVNKRWCLVHATHTEQAEREQAARSGATAGLCPSTEADLGDGFFETEQWLRSGGAFGVGSDSNLRVCPGEELRLLEFVARLRSGKRQVLRDPDRQCGRFLYEQAAAGGARALGQAVGRLCGGSRADLVELDVSHPNLAGRSGDECLESLVFGGDRGMIRSVFVGGTQRIFDGLHADAEQLRDRFLSATRTLLEQ